MEALGLLPDNSVVKILIPHDLAKRFKIGFEQEPQTDDSFVIVTLRAEKFATREWQEIGGGTLEKGFVGSCEILIRVPQDAYKNLDDRIEFAVRQLYEGREVGRMTWWFGQQRKI